MHTGNEAHGACLCGAVHFTARLPARWVAHCHCSPMFFRSPRDPGELHIARAVFNTELLQQPSSQVFVSTRAAWALDAHTLPAEPEG